MHIPHGIIIVWLAHLIPVLGLCWFIGFMLYELNQDYHTRDQAHVDIFGCLVGIVIGGIISAILHHIGVGSIQIL